MAKLIDTQSLEKEYSQLKTLCDSFSIEVTRQIQKLLDDNEITLAVPIQFRTKSWSSICDKCEQGRFTIKKTILELQDLIGIRLILLFKRDIAKVSELIEKHFAVIKKYNTEDRLEENQFGYLSIHEIVQLPDEWLKIPTLAPFKNLKCEIQIRTLVQHAWSEASHIFQYKNEADIPKPLKRTIGRLSALLEIVDLEFERVLNERNEYKQEITTNTRKNEETLNVDLLYNILNNYFPNTNDDSKDLRGYSNLMEDLNSLGYNTDNKLKSLIEKHREQLMINQKKLAEELLQSYKQTGALIANNGATYATDRNAINRLKSGYYYSPIGMIRAILSMHLQKSWSEIKKELNKKADKAQ